MPWSLKAGIALIVIGAVLAFLNFHTILFNEVNYLVNQPQPDYADVEISESDNTEVKDNIAFLSPNFGIAIPKIGANANVILDVDPFSYNQYTEALKGGVAHAKGTPVPGQSGNIFMFAHSAVNFYESGKYNVNFYLLPKLIEGDKIYVSYRKKIYTYEVEKVKIVSRTDVHYLSKLEEYNTLTLMTCWPAGLNINRVIVIAKQLNL